MKSKVTSSGRFSIIMGMIIQVVSLFPWLDFGGSKYNSIMYLFRLLSSGGMAERLHSDLSKAMGEGAFPWQQAMPMTIILTIQLVLLIIMQGLCLLHLILTFKHKGNSLLYAVSLVLGSLVCVAISEGPGGLLDNVISIVYPIIMLCLMITAFLGEKLMEEWDEASKLEHEKRTRQKEYKIERKRRLKFDGKYAGSFYKVIWKNFRFNWKSYQILIFVGCISVALVFASIGMYEMLYSVHEGGNILTGQGLEVILMNFLAVGILVSAFLIIAALLFYLKSNMGNYSILLNLGMRQKTLYLFMGIELAVCVVFSVLGGVVIGNIILFGAKSLIKSIFSGGIQIGAITARTYLFTFLCTVALFFIALLATHDIYLGTGKKAVEKEKMPGKYRNVVFLLGILIMAGSIFLFSKREMAEEIWTIGIFFIGLYLALKNGWAILLREKRKNKRTYYGKLLKQNHFYYRFKTAFRYIFFFTVLHICVMFVFSRDLSSSFIAQETEEMFPYDYVCLATEEDEDFFAELQGKYQTDIAAYPMVRATNVDNTPWLDGYTVPMQPQGQHIGISQSTYEQLCQALGKEAEQLNLSEDGSEIYVIYQQDASVKAHPIDYFMERSAPYIHIGQPVVNYSYLYRKEIFTKRKIAGEEAGILTGAVRKGMHENIIVFSDEYFEKVREDWQKTNLGSGLPVGEGEAAEDVTVHHWPTRLVLMNTEDKYKPALNKELQTFKKKHEFDEKFDSDVLSYYDKEKLVRQIKTERIMNMAVSAFIMCILFAAGIVMMGLKCESEMDERRRKHEFLQCMGMKRKERIQTIKSEMRVFLWVPLAAAAALVPVFTGIMWKLRLYTVENSMHYLKVTALIGLLYIAAQTTAVKCMEHYVIRRVEGKDGENRKSK